MAKTTSQPVSLIDRTVNATSSNCRIVELWKIGEKYVFRLFGDSHNCNCEFNIYIWSPSDYKWNRIASYEDIEGVQYVSYYSATTKDKNGNTVPAKQMLDNMELVKNYMIKFAESIKSC